jgi:hypothetical protein
MFRTRLCSDLPYFFARLCLGMLASGLFRVCTNAFFEVVLQSFELSHLAVLAFAATGPIMPRRLR